MEKNGNESSHSFPSAIRLFAFLLTQFGKHWKKLAVFMAKIGKKPAKTFPPTEHPRPFQSILWQHLELIRLRRRQRHPWRVIVEELQNQHGITTTQSTVMRFFKRARARLQEGSKGLPLGFDEIVEGSKPEEDNIPKQTPRERLRAEAASLEKKTKEREAKWKFTSPYQDKPARKK